MKGGRWRREDEGSVAIGREEVREAGRKGARRGEEGWKEDKGGVGGIEVRRRRRKGGGEGGM